MENRILNLGIMAHVDAGKTTLTEAILYHSGIVKTRGSVDKGTTVTDSLELEQKRGMTIKSSTVSFFIGNVKINLMDTPGHVDFIGEVERSLMALDGVILVISAKEGVQPQTRILFHQLKKMQMPVIIFLNKIDRPGANYETACEQIRSQLTKKMIRMQEVTEEQQNYRIRDYSFEDSAFTEQIILSSEKLLEKYLNGYTVEEKELTDSLQFWAGKGRLYPVYAGSALKDLGIEQLMQAMITWFPVRKPDSNGLSAYVYKLEHDNKGHKKAYIRVFSGTISYKEKLGIAGTEKEIMLHNLQTVREGKQATAASVKQNDIGILTDIPVLKCGDFIGEYPTGKRAGHMMTPMLCVNIQPADKNDRYRLMDALQVLLEEDPLLSVRIPDVT